METPCYSGKAIDEIFRYSKGIPRLINILCDHSLNVGYATDRKKIDEKLVREAIADLEASEQPPAETTGEAQTREPLWSSNPEEKPEEPHRTGLKGKKKKKWGFSSLIFWVCVLLLSGVLLLNFGSWLN
ncbi:MAG: hypothetical protein GTN76_00365, partial [Candidatus Aenigmarchaeota archaeon]|nr:hypothetical protein [Candidatus Aenigmarchaeota archaeon]